MTNVEDFRSLGKYWTRDLKRRKEDLEIKQPSSKSKYKTDFFLHFPIGDDAGSSLSVEFKCRGQKSLSGAEISRTEEKRQKRQDAKADRAAAIEAQILSSVLDKYCRGLARRLEKKKETEENSSDDDETGSDTGEDGTDSENDDSEDDNSCDDGNEDEENEDGASNNEYGDDENECGDENVNDPSSSSRGDRDRDELDREKYGKESSVIERNLDRIDRDRKHDDTRIVGTMIRDEEDVADEHQEIEKTTTAASASASPSPFPEKSDDTSNDLQPNHESGDTKLKKKLKQLKHSIELYKLLKKRISILVYGMDVTEESEQRSAQKSDQEKNLISKLLSDMDEKRAMQYMTEVAKSMNHAEYFRSVNEKATVCKSVENGSEEIISEDEYKAALELAIEKLWKELTTTKVQEGVGGNTTACENTTKDRDTTTMETTGGRGSSTMEDKKSKQWQHVVELYKLLNAKVSMILPYPSGNVPSIHMRSVADGSATLPQLREEVMDEQRANEYVNQAVRLINPTAYFHDVNEKADIEKLPENKLSEAEFASILQLAKAKLQKELTQGVMEKDIEESLGKDTENEEVYPPIEKTTALLSPSSHGDITTEESTFSGEIENDGDDVTQEFTESATAADDTLDAVDEAISPLVSLYDIARTGNIRATPENHRPEEPVTYQECTAESNRNLDLGIDGSNSMESIQNYGGSNSMMDTRKDSISSFAMDTCKEKDTSVAIDTHTSVDSHTHSSDTHTHTTASSGRYHYIPYKGLNGDNGSLSVYRSSVYSPVFERRTSPVFERRSLGGVNATNRVFNPTDSPVYFPEDFSSNSGSSATSSSAMSSSTPSTGSALRPVPLQPVPLHPVSTIRPVPIGIRPAPGLSLSPGTSPESLSDEEMVPNAKMSIRPAVRIEPDGSIVSVEETSSVGSPPEDVDKDISTDKNISISDGRVIFGVNYSRFSTSHQDSNSKGEGEGEQKGHEDEVSQKTENIDANRPQKENIQITNEHKPKGCGSIQAGSIQFSVPPMHMGGLKTDQLGPPKSSYPMRPPESAATASRFQLAATVSSPYGNFAVASVSNSFPPTGSSYGSSYGSLSTGSSSSLATGAMSFANEGRSLTAVSQLSPGVGGTAISPGVGASGVAGTSTSQSSFSSSPSSSQSTFSSSSPVPSPFVSAAQKTLDPRDRDALRKGMPYGVWYWIFRI